MSLYRAKGREVAKETGAHLMKWQQKGSPSIQESQ
jgi:hypothetical protein